MIYGRVGSADGLITLNSPNGITTRIPVRAITTVNSTVTRTLVEN